MKFCAAVGSGIFFKKYRIKITLNLVKVSQLTANPDRRIITRTLTESDIRYGLLKVSIRENVVFPDEEFFLQLDDREIKTSYDKINNRLTTRGDIQRYYEEMNLKPGDIITIEVLEPFKRYRLSSEKSIAGTRVTPESSIEEERWTSFALEEDLRHFLIKNLGRIETGLTLYIDEKGRDGEEYSTDVGNIDILAKDKNGDFVVIELKVSKGSDVTIGQLLRYKGWVRKNLAGGGEVRGIIVASEMDDKIKYAAYAAGDLEILEYKIMFDLRPVSLD